MNYRIPDITDEAILKAYVKEHWENGETSISASLGLTGMEYRDWIQKIHKNKKEGDNNWGKSLLLLCEEEDELVGLLSIRPELTEELSKAIGHIGYGVRPSMRGKGFATKMLRSAVELCRKEGMSQAILGCYKENEASAKVILKCGGQLLFESDNYKKGKMSRYYIIKM